MAIGIGLSGWSRYLDIRDAIALGLSGNIWLAIGLSLFFISVTLLLLHFQKKGITRSRNEVKLSAKQQVLEKVFQDDYDNLAQAVQVKRIIWNMNEIKNDMSYIEAEIHVVNNTA